jgi:hypothetical protein
MSIAEKLKTVAENMPKVFEAGYAKGQAEGGGSYDEGYEAGQQAEYDRFWDAYQQNGKRKDYQNAFSGFGWTDENFKPKYDILHTGTPVYMIFYRSGFVDLGEAIRNSGVSVTFNNALWQYTFGQSPSLEVVEGINIATPIKTISAAFDGCSLLQKIQTLPISEAATKLEFSKIPKLEEISFSGVIPVSVSFAQSSELNDASVQSIIDHLADLTGQTAQTLTLHATVGGKLTQEQKDAVSAKNWTLAY